MATENVSREEDLPLIAARSVGLLEGLMAVASPHLSNAELSAIADQTADVRNILGNIAETADGVAALIADDLSSGALRNADDTSKLLWLFAGHVRHADALLSVAASAGLELRRREAVGMAARGRSAKAARKPKHVASAAWERQMQREQDYPPCFTPALKANRDKRFQAFLARLLVNCT